MPEVWRWVCLALWAVGGAAQAITVLDDRQQTVHIAQAPQRIVSLLPSLTETVCTLGACQRLVGVDRYSNCGPTWCLPQAPHAGRTAWRPWA